MELKKQTLGSLREMLDTKQISAAELCKEYSDSIKAKDSDVLGYITVTEDEALKNAEKAQEIIDKGEADLIVSFEKLEAARYLDYLKPDGTVVVNTQQIDPMPVVTGATVYPQDLIEKMKAAGANVDAMDCLTLAREAGSEKAVNLVLLGRLSRHYDIPLEHWQAAIEVCVPKKFLEINQKAFLLGRNTKLDGEN